MTVAIEVRYPWGRAHATPWGRHTNEGSVEWPPSPRRILRALYATWKTRHPELDEDLVHSLLDSLTVLPTYGTDEVRAGSSRHYLAADKHTAGDYHRDLALDAFVSCRPDRGLIVSWDCALSDEQSTAFGRLAPAVPFLGRADSICEIRITNETPADRPIMWAPLRAGEEVTGEMVDLLVASTPLDIAALVTTPAAVRSTKRLRPEQSKSVPYHARTVEDRPSAARSQRTRVRPTAFRFLLDGRSNPNPFQSLPIAHLLRQAALKLGPDRSPTLSGRQSETRMRDDHHRHAHYLVFGSEGGVLDTAVIWAPEGFDDDHVRRLASLQWLQSRHLKDVPAMRTVLEGVGSVDAVAPELCGPARAWRSATPFVITRYPKDGRPLDVHIAEQVRTELDQRGFGPAAITVSADPDWRRFRRHRPDGRSMRSARPARHVSIEFDLPARGPITLGALSHFSLGLFRPVPER